MSKPTTTAPPQQRTAKAGRKGAQPQAPAAQSDATAARKTSRTGRVEPTSKAPSYKKKPDANPTVNPAPSAAPRSRRTAAPASAPTQTQPGATKRPTRTQKASTATKAPPAAQEAPARPLFRRAASITLQATVEHHQQQGEPSGVPAAASTGAAPQATGTPGPAGAPESVPPKARALTPLEQAFCFEYVQDSNATRAYMRATRQTNERSASVQACRLLADPNIKKRVQEEREALQQRTGVTAEKLLKHLWAMGTADRRELMEHFTESCRFCHGVGHEYQRTDIEFERDRREWETHGRQRIGGVYLSTRKAKERAKSAGEQQHFEPQGGPGFDPHLPPHPACPQCHGHGVGRTVFKDTRLLSPGAALLYAGMKEGKEGLEMKILDPLAALEKVARHIGFYDADNRQKADNPLTALLQAISGPGAGLPVVEHPDDDSGV